MALLSGNTDFFGLDIGTSSIRLVELRGSPPLKTLVRYAHVPVELRVSQSDSKTDQDKLAQLVKKLVEDSKVTSRNVAVGVPSNRVFTTVVDVDRMNPHDLAKSIKFQAGSMIPTPIDSSKVDWAIIGDSPNDKNKVELLLSSVSNDFTEQRLDTLESIGLNVIAFEPDNLALARALLHPGEPEPQMVIDIGHMSTDLVIVMNDVSHLTRSISVGESTIVKAAAQNLNIDVPQAQEVVTKFGVDRTKLEGRVFQAISSTVDMLVGEIDKSIKFFQSRYPNKIVSRIIVTGAASTMPNFPVYMANKFGLNVEIGNAWRNVTFPADRQNELLNVSNVFGVAAGLAERAE